MALKALDRKNPILYCNQSGFTDKINECVIDNPLGMYFLNSFLFDIRTHTVDEFKNIVLVSPITLSVDYILKANNYFDFS